MNNNIETLYPINKKRNNKVLIIIIILILLIGISLFFGLKKINENNDKKHEQPNPVEKEPNNEEPTENEVDPLNKITYYKCTKKQRQEKNYTIDYEYNFNFKGYTLEDGYMSYIYKFNNQNSYQKFTIPKIPNTDYKEIKDDTNLTKTYNFYQIPPQKTEGENAIKDYIKLLQENDYTCNEENSKIRNN